MNDIPYVLKLMRITLINCSDKMKARMKVFLVALLVVLFIPLLSSHSQGDPEEPTDNSSNLLEDLISGGELNLLATPLFELCRPLVR